MSELQVAALTCEYRANPVGIGTQYPRLSWQVQSSLRGTLQTSYQLQVSLDDGFEQLVWDTGMVKSQDSIQIPYEGVPLASRTIYHFRVKIWDNHGRESAFSEPARFETAMLTLGEWKAEWITPDPSTMDPQAQEAFMLRKSFAVTKPIASARIYATGVGLYELYLNGSPVGDAVLSPGWTSYHTRLQYQVYDVTDFLRLGPNGLGMVLGDGWYKGIVGWNLARHHYGDTRAALLQLHVRYEDGTEDVVVTDTSWKAATGAIRYSEIYHGEIYDARLEQEGWSAAEFQDGAWGKVVTTQGIPFEHLVVQENWPTRVTETLRPVAYFVTPAGDHVLDMGQNMVGRMRFTVSAPEGTIITLKHAEVLDQDGNFYTGNLRNARQTVQYITKGEGVEEYHPHFTFQGFRYVCVEGYPNADAGLALNQFVGEVIHSDMPSTGLFECSDDKVNQLQRNIVWGQRGNFVDVPTDCPQRDERLGWTGDAQVFIRTALFNYQGGPFFTKWLRDVAADQSSDGGVPFVVPNILGESSSAAWGDAAVICPWTVYLYYGDKRLLREQYHSMRAWVEYIRAQGDNEALWNTGFHFGDWLALDAEEGSYIGATPTDFIATCFYAYSTRIVRDAAQVLGIEDDARAYGELLARIVREFQHEFVTASGRIASPTQTAHVLPLMFDLVHGDVRERVARELNRLIVENNYHLTTGFIGTPYLCHVLSEGGYHETALRLLLQEDYPGWLYSISKGATTIWEHWDSIKPDGRFWSDDMNSFNHYAYGAVGDWMYRSIAGLDMDESAPAYKRVRIHPNLEQQELTSARAVYRSMYGEVEAAWNISGADVEVFVRIPPNATATVFLPGARMDRVREHRSPLSVSDGVHSFTETNFGVRVEVGSGDYRFTYPKTARHRTYSQETLVLELLGSVTTKTILEKYLPQVVNRGPESNFLKRSALKELVNHPMVQFSEDNLQSMLTELAKA